MKKIIEELYCFAVTGDDGIEGVPAFSISNSMYPMMGSDLERMKSIVHIAKDIEDNHNKKVKLYRFTNKEELPWKEFVRPPVFACAPEDVLKNVSDPNLKPVMK